MKNIDSIGHVTGKSVYLDDIPTLNGTLHATILGSTIAHGRIVKFDATKALNLEGVVRVITYKDITGENQIGGIIPDEPLFAEQEIHFHGHAIALVVATSEYISRKAAALIEVEYEEHTPVVDPREAQQKGLLLIPPRTFSIGNVEESWEKCTYIFEDSVEIGGQEHLYIETQGAYAYPLEGGYIKVHSSTQGPTAVQKTIARALGIPMHMIEVDVVRLGGAFGGKEEQASGFATMAALTAHVLKKPVKLILPRHDDMRMTGKRHPYSADFKIGLSSDYKIISYKAVLYQNGGATADLSPSIMERTLLHSTGAYFIPNTSVTVYSCKTNLPPNTAFRGFGGPQGMFVIESALAKAANELKVPMEMIQKVNLLKEKDEFHYGQIAENVNMEACFTALNSKFKVEKLKAEIEEFNRENKFKKRGVAIMPLCFGISFTTIFLNQARALVHIYQDGSVSVSTGVIEMGQGVNTKLAQIASLTFGIDIEKVKIHSTNTSRVANSSPTAASSGADLNGNALLVAANALVKRLKEVAAEMVSSIADNITIANNEVMLNGKATGISWEKLITTAYLKRVSLSEHGHYATPTIYFDKTKEKGHPFAYHVYGASAITTTVDCIRGTYEIDDVLIVHDFGNSINPTIDLGQVEGAVVQGIGWVTLEELAYNEKGRLLSNSLSTYKVPDIYSAPKSIKCEALDTKGHELAVLKSKAVGEPPFMYGIAAYFAIQNAIKSFNPNYNLDFDLPLTPEKVLMRLYE
ncbi:MAG: xanthine dehydrogenase molybdopterin binding subunit [Bacteroidales bacterium]